MSNQKWTKIFQGGSGKAILINIVFIIYFCHYYFAINRFIFSIILSSLIYVLPGWAWFHSFRKKPRDGVASLLYIVALSFVIYLFGLIFFHAVGMELTSKNLFLYIFIVTNASFFIRKRDSAPKTSLLQGARNLLIPAVFFILVHGYFYWGASTVVTYIRDHDLTSANPVYGLMKHLKPYGLESHFTYMFTKPPLMHFFCGYGITLSDRLEDTKYFYDNAIKTVGTIRMEDRKRWDFIKPIRSQDEKIFRKEKQELRLYTRLSCLFPAVVTAFIMYHVFVKLAGTKLLAFSGTLLYLSIPEVFVRSSYAGYTAFTNFFLAIVVYLFLCFCEEERKEKGLRFSLFLACVLLALTNHKGLLIIPALLFFELAKSRFQFLKSLFHAWGKGFFRAMSEWVRSSAGSMIVLGAITGTVIFWTYGCSIDYENFIKDHVKYEFTDRYHKDGLRVTSAGGRYLDRYPTIPEVWKEFNRNTGIAFLPLSFLSVLYLARWVKRREAFLFFWFLVGAVGFSLADWKQTKHFMLILLPLIIAVMLFISGRGKVFRVILLGIVVCILVINVIAVYKISQDFGYLTITPEW